MNASPDPSDHGVVWVRTEPDIDGTYRLKIEFDEDTSVFLSADEARLHAEYVLIQVATAEHDSMKFRQLAAGSSTTAAAELIVEIRKDRVMPIAPLPLTLTPGVNQRGLPFLTVVINDVTQGQWSVEDARSHAMRVIEGPYWADLDEEYRRALMSHVDLDETTARAAVMGLEKFQ